MPDRWRRLRLVLVKRREVCIHTAIRFSGTTPRLFKPNQRPVPHKKHRRPGRDRDRLDSREFYTLVQLGDALGIDLESLYKLAKASEAPALEFGETSPDGDDIEGKRRIASRKVNWVHSQTPALSVPIMWRGHTCSFVRSGSPLEWLLRDADWGTPLRIRCWRISCAVVTDWVLLGPAALCVKAKQAKNGIHADSSLSRRLLKLRSKLACSGFRRPVQRIIKENRVIRSWRTTKLGLKVAESDLYDSKKRILCQEICRSIRMSVRCQHLLLLLG